MNTPNKLTVGRMIATPIFMAIMLINFPFHYAVSLVLFIAASLTDMIDGKMASGSINLPKSVTRLYFLAILPSIISVRDAAIKSTSDIV